MILCIYERSPVFFKKCFLFSFTENNQAVFIKPWADCGTPLKPVHLPLVSLQMKYRMLVVASQAPSLLCSPFGQRTGLVCGEHLPFPRSKLPTVNKLFSPRCPFFSDMFMTSWPRWIPLLDSRPCLIFLPLKEALTIFVCLPAAPSPSEVLPFTQTKIHGPDSGLPHSTRSPFPPLWTHLPWPFLLISPAPATHTGLLVTHPGWPGTLRAFAPAIPATWNTTLSHSYQLSQWGPVWSSSLKWHPLLRHFLFFLCFILIYFTYLFCLLSISASKYTLWW